MKEGAAILIAIIIAAIRPSIEPGELFTFVSIYKAFAHLFVGWLIGVWWVTGEKLYLGLIVLLTFVELAVGIITRVF